MGTPTVPPSCYLLSGAGARLFVQPADCSKAPWSSSASYSPAAILGALTAAADPEFIGNFSGIPDLKVGFVNQEVFVAAGNGFASSIAGAASGSGTFNMIMDETTSLYSAGIISGALLDFCITFNGTDPAGDASVEIIGRCRVGQPSLPVQLSGEAIMVSIPFITHGQVFGAVIGLSAT